MDKLLVPTINNYIQKLCLTYTFITMVYSKKTIALATLVTLSSTIAHDTQSHVELNGDPWLTEFGHTADMSFSGVTTFGHLHHTKCLDEPNAAFDIALLGIPFDSAVSYRPGEFRGYQRKCYN